MTTPLWCLVIVAILPFVLSFSGGYFRMRQLGSIDNKHPRLQAAKLEGVGARAYAAQANAWEALAYFMAAVVVLRRDTQAPVAGPQLSGQGLSLDEQVLLPRVAQEALALFQELSPQLRGDDALAREELTRAVRRAFKLYTAKRPLVVPLVVRV